jgi:hypothetical protein
MTRTIARFALLAAVAAAGAAGCRNEPAGTDAAPPASDAAAATDAGGATDAAPADTWTNWAELFFTTYCNGCHAPGGSGYRLGELDFRMYALVMANAAEIRCGTAPAPGPADCSGFPPAEQFPIAAPYPTAAERARLVAWIDAGLPF